MERAPWTRRLNRRLPLRFRDLLPQPPLPLPPPPLSHSIASTDEHSSQSTANNRMGSSSSLGSSHRTVRQRLRQVFITARNVFGLSRLYHVAELPSHDPEEYKELS